MAIGVVERGHTSPAALVLHGWKDDPTKGWLGWLQVQLAKRGYLVRAPHLKTDQPSILQSWYAQIIPLMQDLDDRSLIIAHSLGCFIALRMLETMKVAKPLSCVVLVSGFYDAPNPAVVRFFTPEPDWSHIRTQARKFICIYSNDDTIVTPDRTHRLADKLDARLIEFTNRGHFLSSDGMDSWPEMLEFISSEG